MTEEGVRGGSVSDLARQLTACKQWRWMPGMQTSRGLVYDGAGLVVLVGSRPVVPGPGSDPVTVFECIDQPELLPDLTDPATYGCLLTMLWKCDGVAQVQTDRTAAGAEVLVWDADEDCFAAEVGDELGEALAKALLACWGEGTIRAQSEEEPCNS